MVTQKGGTRRLAPFRWGTEFSIRSRLLPFPRRMREMLAGPQEVAILVELAKPVGC